MGRGRGGGAGTKMTRDKDVGQAEFLRWAEAEAALSPHTVAAYRRDLEDYARFLSTRRRSPSRAVASDVVAYLASLRERGRAEATISRRFACLRTFSRFAAAEGLARADATSALEAPRKWRTLPRVPSQGQVAELLALVPADT